MKLLPPTCRYPFQTFLLLTAFLFFNYFVSSSVQSILLSSTMMTITITKPEILQTNITTTTTTTTTTSTNPMIYIANIVDRTTETTTTLNTTNKKTYYNTTETTTSTTFNNIVVANLSNELQKRSLYNSTITNSTKSISLSSLPSSTKLSNKGIVNSTTTTTATTTTPETQAISINDGSRTIQKDNLEEKLQSQLNEKIKLTQEIEKEQQKEQSKKINNTSNRQTNNNSHSYSHSHSNNNSSRDNIKSQNLQRRRRRLQQKNHSISERINNDNNRVGIILFNSDNSSINTTFIQLGFEKFLEFFQINLTHIQVDFFKENGLNNLMKHLENKNYTTIIKTLLTNDISVEENEHNKHNKNNNNNNKTTNMNIISKTNIFNNDNNNSTNKMIYTRNNNDNNNNNINMINNNSSRNDQKQFLNSVSENTKAFSNAAVGLCHLSQGYLKDFNKTVLMWPCPNMKSSTSTNFLPSYEAISFAVKSIANKLDWTEALILVPDTNWGLPLAISANLDIPYQMEIGTKHLLANSKYKDKIGKVIIITSSINDFETIEILKLTNQTIHTNFLLIDIYANAFNTKISFYKNLMKLNPNSKFLSNIFILTILSEKNRLFLDVAFEDEMKSVKNLYHTTRSNIKIKYGVVEENIKDIRGNKETKDSTLIPDFTIFKCQNLQKLDKNIKRLLQKNDEQSKNYKNLSSSSSSSSSSSTSSKIFDLNQINPFTPVELLELCKSENLTKLIENANKNCSTYTKFKRLKERTSSSSSSSSSVQTKDNNNNLNDKLLLTSHRNHNRRINDDSSSGSSSSSSNNDENYHIVYRNLTDIEFTIKSICKNSHPDLIKWNNNVRILKDLIDFFHLYDFIATNLISSKLAKDDTKPSHNIKNYHKSSNNFKNPSKINNYTTQNNDDMYEDNDDDENESENDLNQTVKFNFIVLDINERCTNIRNNQINDNNSLENSTRTSDIILSDKFNGMNSSDDDQRILSNSRLTFKDISSTTNDFNIQSTTTTETSSSIVECTLMWRPFLILEQNKIDLLYVSHPIHPQKWDWDNLNAKEILVRCGTFCWMLIGIAIVLLLVIIVASIALGIAVRNYFLRRRLSRGPNKIVLSANDFVFPVENRRVDEGIEAMLCCWLQQLQEFGGPEVDKPDLLKGSIGSLKNLGLVPANAALGTGGKTTNSGSGSLARHNPTFIDMRARYNGDLVQLKEIPMNGSLELKSKAMDILVMAHGLRHENINPLIGWLSDPSRTAMVFDFCSRGSLQDVLIMDEIKLDWSFRLSLLTDLVRGMRYLHSTPIRIHGSLTSRNCVVDARWVLKITDYGLTTFNEAQGLPPSNKSAKELLWTAPELLRNTKGHNKCGTQLGDVYSFGIIMQEVVVRGEPYCMLSLSPEEIIAKIKKPPPLIRPSVSKGAAPPEAINIMRQCWAEQPDMRPDFVSVYERFKMLNHGRKVNFVDTMFQMLEKYSNNLEELIRERTEQLDIERKKTEQLLNRMLPSSVAEKLKMGLAVDPEEFADVTIYFSDIVGFTTIAAHCSPVQVVDLLNDLYTIFDATINAYNVYKVETIGDAYMVVSGLPVKIPDHAEQIATMALDLLHESGSFKVKHLPGVPLQLRIGLHTGPCCAGVVGLTMPRYCLFGDTVNTASRMESTGSSSRIHMSEATCDRLEAAGGYYIEARGPIEIKGKGLMNTFWLLGKKGFDKPLPVPPPVGESHRPTQLESDSEGDDILETSLVEIEEPS